MRLDVFVGKYMLESVCLVPAHQSGEKDIRHPKGMETLCARVNDHPMQVDWRMQPRVKPSLMGKIDRGLANAARSNRLPGPLKELLGLHRREEDW